MNFRIGKRPIGWLIARMVRRGAMLAFAAMVSFAQATAGELVVAHVAPMSTPEARDYATGVALALERANAAGGIGGQRLVLRSFDDGGSPQLARDQAQAALGARPVAFVGTTSAASIEAQLYLLARADVALLAPVVDAPGVALTRHPNVFHIRPTVRQEAASIVDNLVSMGMRRIAVCYQSDGFGPSGFDGALTALRRQGLQAVAIMQCDAMASHLDAAARAIAGGDPQAVVFVGNTGAAARFIRTLRAAGSYAMVVANSTVDPQALMAQLPPEASTWIGIAQAVPNPRMRVQVVPLVREFAESLARRSPDAIPTRAGLEGYVAGSVLVAALERAARQAYGRAPSSTDLLLALGQTRQLDLGGLQVSFDRDSARGLDQVRVGLLNAAGRFLN